jgi:hypothetical protein
MCHENSRIGLIKTCRKKGQVSKVQEANLVSMEAMQHPICRSYTFLSRIFCSYADVTTASEKIQKLSSMFGVLDL